jgi:hypothetical protein
LLERPGDLVTRKELQERLWPDTFVDFEDNLNTAVNKIREVLGDSAENSRLVETLPRRGYRFIGAVESMRQSAAPVEPVTTKVQGSRRLWLILGAIIVVAVVALATTDSKVIDHPGIVVAMHNRSENPMTTVRGLYHKLERCVHCALEDH